MKDLLTPTRQEVHNGWTCVYSFREASWKRADWMAWVRPSGRHEEALAFEYSLRSGSSPCSNGFAPSIEKAMEVVADYVRRAEQAQQLPAPGQAVPECAGCGFLRSDTPQCAHDRRSPSSAPAQHAREWRRTLGPRTPCPERSEGAASQRTED